MTEEQEYKQWLKETKKLQKQGVDLVLKRTNTTREQLLKDILNFWVSENLDVLTKEERKKFGV